MASKIVIVGLSGVSSSGKTTLARLLRDIFPQSFILHEDDFYWPDSQIPVRGGVQDWDCLGAIDVTKLADCLQYIKQNFASPPELHSKEDQNSVGECTVDTQTISTCRSRVACAPSIPRIAFIDGFLLYSPEMVTVRNLLDLKLFLRTDYQTAKSRREARSGYVTLEGFWEDPPGYVDNVVWPNYVKDHAFMFVDGDVEGAYNQVVCDKCGIDHVPADLQSDMTSTLEWACSKILQAATQS